MVATVKGKPLRTTAVVWHMVRMCNSAGFKRCLAINFIVADIVSYDVILGMAWLQKQNPDILWNTGIWHWRTQTDAENGPICLFSAITFVATMRA